MDIQILEYLICPYCASDLILKKKINSEKNQFIWGLISCEECRSTYPVVEGIPIIMPAERRINMYAQTSKFGVDKLGMSVADICQSLERGNIDKVRQSIIYSIQYEPAFLPAYLEKIVGSIGKKIIHKVSYSLYHKRMLEKRLRTILEDNRSTAFEAMQIYYQNHELFNYFFFKFGQPRFLVTLGLASIIERPVKPILDLACGQGHLMHFLTYQQDSCPVIGLDRNFIQLFLAKKYIAPSGHYICAEADEKLPFKSKVFSHIICSDAFHYFQNKSSCIDDLKSIKAEDGAIILTRVGNQKVEPNEGAELTPGGYLKLFKDTPVRMIGDDEVLNNYLQKKKPDLLGEGMNRGLKDMKWLSFVASENDGIFKRFGKFDEWPHSIGHLALNPLYKKSGMNQNGKELYRFSYPSEWYEFEDSQWQDYTPEEVVITSEIFDLMKNDRQNPEIRELIRNFVILGMPKKYL